MDIGEEALPLQMQHKTCVPHSFKRELLEEYSQLNEPNPYVLSYF